MSIIKRSTLLVGSERVAGEKLVTLEGTAKLPYHRLLWQQLNSKF